jgi:DNA-directed RNA polymerase beta subunit
MAHSVRFMIQKLYSLVAGDCSPDNPDSPQHQEILLGGHLYGMYLKVNFKNSITCRKKSMII